MIKLYQYEVSPYCTKIALILNVKGIPYEVVEVPISKSRTIRRYSPTSKLPTIEHEGRYIDDSTDIAYYLEERFPEPSLIPREAKLFSKCHLYEDWADESLNFYMMKLRWLPQNRRRWAEELAKYDTGLWRWIISKFIDRATLNILDKQGVGRKSEKAALRDIDRHLSAISVDLQENHFLVGDRLSLADISVFSQLKWMYKVNEGKSIIDKYPAINQWRDRVDKATSSSA
jgi:glutathione S-transferase